MCRIKSAHLVVLGVSTVGRALIGTRGKLRYGTVRHVSYCAVPGSQEPIGVPPVTFSLQHVARTSLTSLQPFYFTLHLSRQRPWLSTCVYFFPLIPLRRSFAPLPALLTAAWPQWPILLPISTTSSLPTIFRPESAVLPFLIRLWSRIWTYDSLPSLVRWLRRSKCCTCLPRGCRLWRRLRRTTARRERANGRTRRSPDRLARCFWHRGIRRRATAVGRAGGEF